MPYALVLVGLVLTVAGARDTHTCLFALLKGDFTGQGNFVYWLAAVAAVGALGYIPEFKKVSVTFLALIFVVLVVKNQGVFDQLKAALAKNSASASSPDAAGVSAPAPLTAGLPPLNSFSPIPQLRTE